MFGNPSLFTRIVVGKTIGLIIGLLALIILPRYLPGIGWIPRLGILFWYTTFGAIIGVFGTVTRHPMLNMSMPWWFRGAFIGAWLNFVLAFFAYDLMAEMMVAVFGVGGALSSPFWFAAEGAVIGLLIDYFATRFGGEGPEATAA